MKPTPTRLKIFGNSYVDKTAALVNITSLKMKYGWNVDEVTSGEPSREFYYVNLLVDNIMVENLPEVTSLLKTKKANPNTVVPELGVAPLHLLAGLENEDFSCKVTQQAILRNGGNPNVRSEEGLTPVHVAAMWGRCKVLEILLSYGGDPDMIDDQMFLTAEEYAMKERQWEAYGILSTFSAIADRYKTDMFLEGKSGCIVREKSPDKAGNKSIAKFKEKSSMCSDDCENYDLNSCRYCVVKKEKINKKQNQTDDEALSLISSRKTIELFDPYEDMVCVTNKQHTAISRQRIKTNIYESHEDIPKNVSETNKTLHSTRDKFDKCFHYGDSVSDSCDWLTRSGDWIKLDNNTINTIKTQRSSSKIYHTKGLGEDPLKTRQRNPPIYEESETHDWIDSRYHDKFDKSSLKKIHAHRITSSTYENEDSENINMLCSCSKLQRRNSITHHRKSEDSESYLGSDAEKSVGTNMHQDCHRYPASNRMLLVLTWIYKESLTKEGFAKCPLANEGTYLCKQ